MVIFVKWEGLEQADGGIFYSACGDLCGLRIVMWFALSCAGDVNDVPAVEREVIGQQ